jgi:hypothetical protein
VGNRVGKIGAVKTSGLTRLPNEGGRVPAYARIALAQKNSWYSSVTRRFSKSQITSRKVSPENRLGDIFFRP